MYIMELIYKLPLPTEIVRDCIIPYTYNCQPCILCNDIRNFYTERQRMINIYGIIFKKETQLYENELNDWIANDITSFANEFNPTQDGYVINFYTIFSRHVRLYTDNDVDLYIKYLFSKPIHIQINIIWSLFTPHERMQFLLLKLVEVWGVLTLFDRMDITEILTIVPFI
jgi:hypothetical protein